TYAFSRLAFTREAYAQRKSAFGTDVVRLEALYRYGGVYMDTDVEILRPLDDALLSLPGFTGFESNTLFSTGIMASEAGASWVGSLLQYYQHKHFIRWNGKLNKTPNTLVISRHFKDQILPNNEHQVLEGQLHIFPSDYFCPKSYATGKIQLTENSYCIHHFAGSWIAPKAPLSRRIGWRMQRLWYRISQKRG
ncbi:MAG: glycosyltransferase, partial [Alistipes sp.]|nr:glycosyltransferase [Alistipes sp.]